MIDTGRRYPCLGEIPCELGRGLTSRIVLAVNGRTAIPHCTRPFIYMQEPTLEELIDPVNVFSAMHDSESGVRWKASVQSFEINTLRWASSIRNEVRDGSFKSKGFRRFDITERGKLRHIQAVHIEERTIQKLLCRHALKPVIQPKLIYDNSASIENKGTQFALKRLVEHLRWHYARYGKKGTVIVMDFHGYFDSIPHDKAIAAMCEGQGDPTIKKYIARFIDEFDGDVGVGLGSEVSQVCAALYPTPLDKMIKEKFRIHCYGRYNDDSYIIHPDRQYAVQCLNEIKKKAKELGLEINERKVKIHNLASDDFVFLKKRVHLTDSGKVILRLTRANIIREEQRIRDHMKEYNAGRMPFMAILQSYQCWRSYAKTYNAYAAVGRMDKYFVEIMRDVIRKETNGKRINFARPDESVLVKHKQKQ